LHLSGHHRLQHGMQHDISEAWLSLFKEETAPSLYRVMMNVFQHDHCNMMTCLICSHQWTDQDIAPNCIWTLRSPDRNGVGLQDLIEVELQAQEVEIRCPGDPLHQYASSTLGVVQCSDYIVFMVRPWIIRSHRGAQPQLCAYKITAPEEHLQIGSSIYQKHAFVCHRGDQSNRGHYVAYTKIESTWWLCNDNEVMQSPTGANPNARERLFLAVYKRQPPLPSSPPPPLPPLPPPPLPPPPADVKATRKRPSTAIQSMSLNRLDEGGLLNDDVIACYFKEILAPQFPSCAYLDPAFYTKLSTTNSDIRLLFRWFRTIDLSKVEKVQVTLNCVWYLLFPQILIPIHQPGHWCLTVVDMVLHRLEYYDSLSKQPSEARKVGKV